MRLYACSMFVMAIEISSILIVYQQGPYVMRTSILMILTTIIVGVFGAKLLGLVGVATGGFAAVLVGALRNYTHIVRVTETPLRNIQNWKTIAVIFFSAITGSLVAHPLAVLMMSDYSVLVQLPAMLVLTFIFYAALIVALGQFRLFGMINPRRDKMI